MRLEARMVGTEKEGCMTTMNATCHKCSGPSHPGEVCSACFQASLHPSSASPGVGQPPDSASGDQRRAVPAERSDSLTAPTKDEGEEWQDFRVPLPVGYLDCKEDYTAFLARKMLVAHTSG